jgi:uncharacterized membrane protein (UPF0127 family)
LIRRHHALAASAALLLSMLLLLPRLAMAEVGAFEPLTIESRSGRHDFLVEVMRTDAEQAKGMMFRRSLAEDRGMLFQFQAEKIASFWMQNTYVSLDMLFIRADGTIHRIERRAEPLSTRSISSGEPVLAVLEVVAGTADRLGLAPGDHVIHPMFRR